MMPYLKRDNAILIAIDQLYKPYIYAANGPDTFDCSGLIVWILRSLGEIPDDADLSAQMLYDAYCHKSLRRPVEGALAFYGRDTEKITHVMLCLSPRACIGATGGNSRTVTLETAKARNAYVKVKPIKYRKDLIAIVDPF